MKNEQKKKVKFDDIIFQNSEGNDSHNGSISLMKPSLNIDDGSSLSL